MGAGWNKKMNEENLRGIVVVDVGYTNTKAILFSSDLKIVAERKILSSHRDGPDYKIIDAEPVFAFLAKALSELDAILPVDCIVPTAHGACIVCVNADRSLAFPIMDYASEPPLHIIAEYEKLQPKFSEVYCTLLPMALTHGLQLYWQQQLDPQKSSAVKSIMPWMQYIAFRLCGVAATEISSMACQTQLIDVNTQGPSSLAMAQGWDKKFAPCHQAWDRLGTLKAEFKGTSFRGRADVLTGVHDSNGNYLRYLAGGLKDFTLLSTGTWVISFNSSADITKLDHEKDTNTNTDVLGNTVACSRFFGGKELEILSADAATELASLATVQKLIDQGTMALPSFTYSSGPVPGSADRGRIIGPAPTNAAERASLAALYCAQMVSAQLDAVDSRNQIIVDGPFSTHPVFLSVLAQLRPGQKISASNLRDGTAAGAACLALMTDKTLPHIEFELTPFPPAKLSGMEAYQNQWWQLVKTN
jgi:sugar (pentulose or hexulose) kinase